eukprot:TRINITY_DN61904_c0_g1_i3.p1 TRINITY_DN61904_c0_g1~~TRINITY_DN61904_c0_g1_i3.p1  ORF type:complete len:165 (-),score=14.86 TRINITY_DN61904_c0_g1_i3:263-718(-)
MKIKAKHVLHRVHPKTIRQEVYSDPFGNLIGSYNCLQKHSHSTCPNVAERLLRVGLAMDCTATVIGPGEFHDTVYAITAQHCALAMIMTNEECTHWRFGIIMLIISLFFIAVLVGIVLWKWWWTPIPTGILGAPPPPPPAILRTRTALFTL